MTESLIVYVHVHVYGIRYVRGETKPWACGMYEVKPNPGHAVCTMLNQTLGKTRTYNLHVLLHLDSSH